MRSAEKELQQQVGQLASSLDFFHDTLTERTNQLSRVFFQMFPQGVMPDPTRMTNVGEYRVAALTSEGEVLNNNFSRPDQFTAMTGGTATVFMRVGDDFLRVSTSLRKADGSRAFGTMLGQKHPGYKTLMAGEVYAGPANLFGRNYMTRYEPVVAADGKVIAVLYVGFDYTEELAALKDTLAKLSFGDSGYAYLVNIDAKHNGEMVWHPKGLSDGITAITGDDSILSRMRQFPQGQYHFDAASANGAKDRLEAWAVSERWQWAVVGGSYSEEFLHESVMTRNLMLLASFIAALFIVLMLFISVRRRLRPIDQICGYMQALGEGDLSFQVETDQGVDAGTRNEVQRLSRSVARTLEGLRSVTQELRGTAGQMVSHIGEVAAGVSQLGNDIGRQQQETEMVAAAVSELTATAAEVAGSAESAASQTQLADGEAQQGNSVVQNVVEAIEGITTEVNLLTEMIERVEQDSNNIGSVVQVIQNIAEQTNLLALNAAIEAARAGEAGRGFSVVADEVRHLAQQTQTSTTEIRDMIERLQSNTREAVRRMDHSNQCVKHSVELTGTAGNALNTITAAVSNISDTNMQIASAAGQQTAVSEDVSRNIESINQIALETAGAGRHMEQSLLQLEQVGNDLQRVIARFRG